MKAATVQKTWLPLAFKTWRLYRGGWTDAFDTRGLVTLHGPHPQDVTDAELSVLQLLWELETATVRDLTERLYPQGTSSLTATVQKLLERLEAKHYVKRSRKTWPHRFSSAVDRHELIARQLQTTADKLCQGEIQPLLSSLVKARGLTEEDRKSLRGLLDELDREKKQ